jgi:nitric oxide dioxygenase
LIELSPPFGDFNLRLDRATPVVLISGGVGLTPMVSMLNHVIREQPDRPVVFVHGARHRGVHALGDHIRDLGERHPRLDTAIFYELVGSDDRPGVDYHHVGRVDLAAIHDRVVLPDADYYLCGPVPFMRAKMQELQQLGVPATRIHYEVFGSSLAAAA